MIQIIQTTNPRDGIADSPIERICDPTKIKESYSDYLRDESHYSGGNAECIFFPKSESEIQKLVLEATRDKTPLTISAGRTGIVGGAIPLGGIVLSLEKMDRFLKIEWDQRINTWILTLEPGVSLERISRFLDSGGETEKLSVNSSQSFALLKEWFYAPILTEQTAHVGGTVSTNASGRYSFFYGSTRDHILGLRVVLTNGAILNLKRGQVIVETNDELHIEGPGDSIILNIPEFKRRKIKNTAGYYLDSPLDLIDLFIGSEGTLGVLTEIQVLLTQKLDSIIGGIAFFKTDIDALKFARRIKNKKNDTRYKIKPIALEYFDRFALDLVREQSAFANVLPEYACAAIYFEQPVLDSDTDIILVEYDQELMDCNSSLDETWGAMDSTEIEKMNSFRHAIPEIINMRIGQIQQKFPNIHKIGTDFVVPDDFFEVMMQCYRDELTQNKLEHVIFGHIGENHVHVNIFPQNDKEMQIAKDSYLKLAQKSVELGGSVSGEHGIGKIKKHLLKIMYNEKEIEIFSSIKNQFDCKGILSPENLF